MNGLKILVGIADSISFIISLDIVFISPVNANTGKNNEQANVDTATTNNIKNINRRIILKPILLSVEISSITQILDTTEINTVGIVMATINFIKVSRSGIAKSLTINVCKFCGK